MAQRIRIIHTRLPPCASKISVCTRYSPPLSPGWDLRAFTGQEKPFKNSVWRYSGTAVILYKAGSDGPGILPRSAPQTGQIQDRAFSRDRPRPAPNSEPGHARPAPPPHAALKTRPGSRPRRISLGCNYSSGLAFTVVFLSPWIFPIACAAFLTAAGSVSTSTSTRNFFARPAGILLRRPRSRSTARLYG